MVFDIFPEFKEMSGNSAKVGEQLQKRGPNSTFRMYKK